MALSIVNGNTQTTRPLTIVINGSNGTSTSIDLSKLSYFANDEAAGAINVATNKPYVELKGYYLASEDNTMGVPVGSLKRREY
jgi:hypothetical protein